MTLWLNIQPSYTEYRRASQSPGPFWREATPAELATWEGENVPSNPVPDSVSPRQIRRALNQLGLRATVDAAIAMLPQDARDDWDYALEVRRDWPLVASLAAGLGKTEAEIDDIFRLAATF